MLIKFLVGLKFLRDIKSSISCVIWTWTSRIARLQLTTEIFFNKSFQLLKIIVGQ